MSFIEKVLPLCQNPIMPITKNQDFLSIGSYLGYLLSALALSGCLAVAAISALHSSFFLARTTESSRFFYTTWIGSFFFLSGAFLLSLFLSQTKSRKKGMQILRTLSLQKPIRMSDNWSTRMESVFWILLFLIISWLNDFLTHTLPGEIGEMLRLETQNYQNLFLRISTAPNFFPRAFISIGIATGLAEELFFRGALQTSLEEHLGISSQCSMMIVALLFTIVHLNLSGFLPILCMALLLGRLRQKSQSVLPGAVVHIAYNTLVILYNCYA